MLIPHRSAAEWQIAVGAIGGVVVIAVVVTLVVIKRRDSGASASSPNKVRERERESVCVCVCAWCVLRLWVTAKEVPNSMFCSVVTWPVRFSWL